MSSNLDSFEAESVASVYEIIGTECFLLARSGWKLRDYYLFAIFFVGGFIKGCFQSMKRDFEIMRFQISFFIVRNQFCI